MKRLAMIVIGMILFFSLLFVIGEKMGMMNEAYIQGKIVALQESRGGQAMVTATIIGLLVVDILLPVPSSIVMALSGKLLGAWIGGTVAFVGAMAAAWIGFFACRFGGDKMFKRIVGGSDSEKVRAWFEEYGVIAIILSRPVPMLTEILSCLAGLSHVSVLTFSLATILGTLPICFVYSYVGAQGDLTDPWPAIWISIAIPAVGWFFARWVKRRKTRMEVVTDD